jgi:HD-GYP domain-containing protein (c-di-GMP phosphodiesterase class II)
MIQKTGRREWPKNFASAAVSDYHRLRGKDIPLIARIGVADVYEAVTSGRPYRQAWPPEKARQFFWAERGRPFCLTSTRSIHYCYIV